MGATDSRPGGVAWQRQAARRARLAGAVQVWLADPQALPASMLNPAPPLCKAERARAAALRFDADRQLYTAAHTLLRHLLSRYLPGAPAAWCFVANPHGRPDLHPAAALGGGALRHPLRFSLSHTAGLVAVAVGWGWDVGVDVEKLRPGLEVDAVSPALLSALEQRWYGALPAADREAAFLGLWTMKESLLKALGVGIGEDLQQIALMPGWRSARAVLAGLPGLRKAGPGGMVLARLATGHALAVSALGPLTRHRPAPLPTDTLPGATAPRRVDIFDLRADGGRRRPPLTCLPVIDIACAAPRVSTLETSDDRILDTACF